MSRPVDLLLEKIIAKIASSRGIPRQDMPPRRALAALLGAWSHHWGDALDAKILDVLVERVFASKAIASWSQALTDFFPAAEELMRLNLDKGVSCPELAMLLEKSTRERIEAQLHALQDSATYAGQDEWDSLFGFTG
ncbi:MAG: hypothetical protein JW839_20690 [Candidatus Lokiarchaeota archaeon]|nr:hypothetical protein [Candidatus Lokiarchaeota archaeon]